MAKNILIVLNKLSVGGAEIRILEWLRFFKCSNYGVTFTVFISSGERGILDDDYQSAGAVLIYGSPRLRGLGPFFKHLRKTEYDVLHVNAGYGSGIFCFFGWLSGINKRISHLRSAGLPEANLISRIKYIIYLPVLNLFSTTVVGVSDACRDISRTNKKKWVTLYNGIQPSGLLPSFTDKGIIKVALVGRQHVCKNIPFALKVLNELKKYCECELHLIGNEDPKVANEIRSLEEDLRLKHNVIHHGQLKSSEARQIVAHSNVLLLTSTREGLPGSILEACEIGIPALSSNLPGVQEIKRYIPSVMIKNLIDGPEEWARTICNMVGHNEISELPNEIRAKFKDSPFTLDRHMEKLIAVWGIEKFDYVL